MSSCDNSVLPVPVTPNIHRNLSQWYQNDASYHREGAGHCFIGLWRGLFGDTVHFFPEFQRNVTFSVGSCHFLELLLVQIWSEFRFFGFKRTALSWEFDSGTNLEDWSIGLAATPVLMRVIHIGPRPMGGWANPNESLLMTNPWIEKLWIPVAIVLDQCPGLSVTLLRN